MSLLDHLEPKFRRLALPHLTLVLIFGQVLVYAVSLLRGPEAQVGLQRQLVLVPNLVLAGEIWRLVSFLIVPPVPNLLFAIFFWYLFYLMGTALEQHWGTFRYNVYLFIGYLATVGVAFLVPNQLASNGYLLGSVFLAFAVLYPDFEMYLFFLLPVKIKWLALLTWIGYFFVLVLGSPVSRLLVLASICNFLLFFGKDIIHRVRTGRRRMALQAAQLAVRKPSYYHRCTVCGITDRTHPQMDFRYCSKCVGAHAYCAEHLGKHEHITTAEEASGACERPD